MTGTPRGPDFCSNLPAYSVSFMCVKKLILTLAILLPSAAWAQYKDSPQEADDSTLVLTLDDALKIALSENTSVKVADMEVQRQKYARKGAYGALFPQINATGMYSYAIQKQQVILGPADASSGGGGGGVPPLCTWGGVPPAVSHRCVLGLFAVSDSHNNGVTRMLS